MWIVCLQTIHMKCQDLFSKKNKKKKYLKVSSAAVVIGTLRVKILGHVTGLKCPNI